MNRIEQVFGSDTVLLPVIHPVGRREALDSLRVVTAAGVKGVFLINQGMNEDELLQLVLEVRGLYPALWIGVNLLGPSPAQALEAVLDACGQIDGIWSDNAGIDDRGVHANAVEFVATRRARGWGGLYFGGVAFKYQRESTAVDLGRVTATAVPYMDVVCTSGAGTGIAADAAKPAAMRAALSDHALALASGVSPDNVRAYMPYVNAFLVGTGLEARLGVIDAARLEALQRAMC
jgi:predicted TIM-barrel enzyme